MRDAATSCGQCGKRPLAEQLTPTGPGPARAILFGSLTIAATILAGFLLLAFVGGEETDAYKGGYSEGYAAGGTESQSVREIAKDDACDADGLRFGDRQATPTEADDYEDGCRDGYGDASE